MSGSGGEPWFVYVLASEVRRVTYVGVAKDTEARLLQHNGERPGGAKSTRAARPWRVARVEGPFANRGEAQRREARLKRLVAQERLGGGRDGDETEAE